MAVLAEQDRFDTWKEAMQDARFNNIGQITKQQLRAVVDALDVELDSQASTFNQAIPQPQRGALSANDKALLLMYIISKRYVKGV